MKNQKIILFFIVSFTFLLTSFAWAADTCPKDSLCFTPAITIPGFYTANQLYEVSPASLPEYIVAVYRYGGIFAGVVAMFMLVYAGWQWLLAGGNGAKISQAKEKINGVLMGLFLLFGGYLLLSLISERLVSFKTLQTQLPEVPCAAYTTESSCPKDTCQWNGLSIELNQNKGICINKSSKISCESATESTACSQLSGICRWENKQCRVYEKCNITKEELDIFIDSEKPDSFNLHCCAMNLYGGGFSSYKYAIFGDRDRNLSCHWVCGAGSPERPLSECATALGWGGGLGSGEW